MNRSFKKSFCDLLLGVDKLKYSVIVIFYTIISSVMVLVTTSKKKRIRILFVFVPLYIRDYPNIPLK